MSIIHLQKYFDLKYIKINNVYFIVRIFFNKNVIIYTTTYDMIDYIKYNKNNNKLFNKYIKNLIYCYKSPKYTITTNII